MTACCHNWRCPTSEPPYDYGMPLSGGHPRTTAMEGADLGTGSLDLRSIPRDEPCEASTNGR